MCNRTIEKGLDCYWCRLCRYYLHQECAKLPEHIDHSFHPLHGLKLTKRSLNDTCRCYYCEKPLENDEYLYACDKMCSDFFMHMTCAMIPLPTITSNVDGCKDHDVAQFACHQRPMTLMDHGHHLSNKRAAKCFGCQSNWSGPAYSCISENCENFLHKSCGELPQKIQHAVHSPHSLILQVSKPQSCRSCCKKDCRLIFCCREDGCDFTLGTECVSLDTTINYRGHAHLLSLVEKSFCDIECDACEKSYGNVKVVPKEVNRTRSFMFRCMECVFNFHFLCGPLPSTVKYEYHIHPLILSEHSISEDDSDEYFCDVCEEERDQSFRIYYCEECKFAAHIHCLIHEILKAIKGETKDIELKILRETRWDNLLKIESMDHQLKENSSESTLKEIRDMLTEPENEMLLDPFGFKNPSDKVFRSNSYKEYRRFNSRFDREGSIEDIDRIKQFFYFERKNIFRRIFERFREMDDFEMFLEELRYFTPEEGLLKLLDDKYLRQKVEDVDGYMVPNTLAPILKTLLGKYGKDLVGRENLTSAMKSIASTMLCIVVDKMCNTSVEDITKDDLRHLYFYLTGIQEVTGFTLTRYLDSFDEILEAFLGFEATRFEKGIREKLEAEMERCRRNLEKLEVYTSDMSNFMQNCSRKASEWKQKNWGDKWF
ncbi:hypothetical protein L484_020715 [Morus notabilis]|uniref:Zinc finger PHD-type domain-containing protein n=1 Tax=Morus notabilis TaxID=981085 RepID=W9QM10_9ROSA|nr:hypothetical protein L484_020715 [Morus notabilis]